MILVERIKKAGRIAIYGAQATACGVASALIDVFGNVPEAIIVSNLKGNPIEIRGVKVIELKEAFELKDCLILVAVPVNLHEEILSVLCRNGFTNYTTIDSDAEYELMSLYYKKVRRFPLLRDAAPADAIPNVKILMARSVFDKELSDADLLNFNKRGIQEIHAGAALSEDRIAEITDKDGDNISKHNRQFSELTVTYWAWKNVEADYKGICHYRRVLDIPEDDYNKLSSVDVVLPLPFTVYPNASSQFLRFIHEEEYNALLLALREIAPEYYVAAHKFWYEPYLYNYNILIAKEKIFNSYCEFIFNVLFAVKKSFSDKGIRQNNRYIGYLGEILTSLYFMVNEKQVRVAHAKKLWLV